MDFIIACRNGASHSYDIVEGPMADDSIFNYVQNFMDGEDIKGSILGTCKV